MNGDEKKTWKDEARPSDNTRDFYKQREMLKYYRDYVTIFERENNRNNNLSATPAI